MSTVSPVARSVVQPGAAAVGGVSEGGTSVYDPLIWFGASEVGALLDPSDISSLFQDSAGTTPVTADGDPVGRISDLSGNANHFTSSGSARPTYRTSGGKHWLEFDGTDDKLTATNATAYLEDHSIIFGGSCDRAGSGTRAIIGWAANDVSLFWGDVANSASAIECRGYAGTRQVVTLTYSSPSVISSRRIGTNATFRQNGTELLSSSNYDGTQAFLQLFAAGASVTGGRFYGLITSANTSVSLAGAESWMAAKL